MAQPSRTERRAAERASQGSTGRKGQRVTIAQAARRWRIITWLSIGTGVVIVAIVIIAVLASSGSGGLTDQNALNPAASRLAVGTQAPDFTASTVDGKQYSLSGQRGHTVLLEFFAVWCPHCQREAPILNNLERSFLATGLRTLAVLANAYGKDYDTSYQQDTRLADKSDISWFTTTFNVKHPILVERNFATTNTYGAGSYPTLYVIDRHGIIRYSASGDVPYNTLAAAVTAADKK